MNYYIHDLIHVVMIPSALWLWNERRILQEVLEGQIERRHKGEPMNFVSGLLLAESEAIKISAFISKVPTYLPLIQQNIADLQKAAADKTNPAAEMADVSALLNDLNSDLTLLLTVAPALKPTAPAPAAPIVQTPPPAAA